jgi:hypothetical protein
MRSGAIEACVLSCSMISGVAASQKPQLVQLSAFMCFCIAWRAVWVMEAIFYMRQGASLQSSGEISALI